MAIPHKPEPFPSAEKFINALIGFAHGKGLRYPTALYRGVRNADFDLKPSAFREYGEKRLLKIARCSAGLKTDSLNTPNTHRIAELIAIAQFYRTANRQGLRLPQVSQPIHQAMSLPTHYHSAEPILNLLDNNWPPADLWPVMALAQHHGVPTRLLDWTTDILTAIYFAAAGAFEDLITNEETTNQKLAVWITLPQALDRTTLYSPTSTHSQTSPNGAPAPDYGVRMINTPTGDNPNLAAQSGHFTVVLKNKAEGEITDRTTLDSAVSRIVDHYEKYNWNIEELTGPGLKAYKLVMEFSLPITEAPDLLLRLRRLNYGVERLFPGFDGCARAVTEETELLQYFGLDAR